MLLVNWRKKQTSCCIYSCQFLKTNIIADSYSNTTNFCKDQSMINFPIPRKQNNNNNKIFVSIENGGVKQMNMISKTLEYKNFYCTLEKEQQFNGRCYIFLFVWCSINRNIMMETCISIRTPEQPLLFKRNHNPEWDTTGSSTESWAWTRWFEVVDKLRSTV